jgi:outer membrane protein OmpA-like peptidoglycan-associated protein
MANVVSTLGKLSLDLLTSAAWPAVAKLIPILLAAALVGCATSAQHRASGELASKVRTSGSAPVGATQPAYRPAPYEEPARSGVTPEQTAAAPQAFKDDGATTRQEESSSQPELFADEGAEAQKDDHAPPPQQFTDETGPVAEEKPFVQYPFVDDAVPPKDDVAAGNQRFSDDAEPAKDDIVAQQKFTDDAPAMKEDPIAPRQFTDDAAPVKDDLVAQQHFVDETVPPATEGGSAPEVFKDEGADTETVELVRPPETFADDEKLAEAEEPKLPAATMLPMTITVEADPLFDFDQYAIRPESRKKLDDLAQQLKGIPYGEVITVGFADPIGTRMYNQNLSQRRAAAVEQYLLSKDVPADKIRVEARGATQEYATYQDCSGQGKQKLIECLQPDRRVEVTVTATKQQ